MPEEVNQAQTNNSQSELTEILQQVNPKLTIFLSEWLRNGLCAKRAYQAIHPDTDDASAATLGSRWLRKVDFSLILGAYSLNIEAYLRQLNDGLEATTLNSKQEIVPDHRVRRLYHAVLGQLLNIEVKEATLTAKMPVFKGYSWYKPRGNTILP